MNNFSIPPLNNHLKAFASSLKWIFLSLIVGSIAGSLGTIFYFALNFVTNFRKQNSWIIYFLPLAGICIVFLYRIFKDEKDTGTNLVLSAIHSNEHIPLRMAPLIFISTILTHLFGGSAGREGAALQMGGSLGNSLGRLFKLDDKDKKIMIMSGMSAAFCSLFGTPMAAAIFSIEVVSVGVMYYAALVPCVISSLTANAIATYFGAKSAMYKIFIPTYNLPNILSTSLITILTALVSILFCIMLHYSGHLFKKYFENPYYRIIAGGLSVQILTLLLRTHDYNGAGIDVIHNALAGNVCFYTFFLKIVFTCLTLSSGYKGGEIVPSFFIGATFGSVVGLILGINPAFASAIGMISCFCGVTNCPISSLLISFELFGYQGMPFFLITTAFSYLFSGYFGLYTSQKIIYSKYKTNYINKPTI
ncbi:chloride channel protein [Lachnobacterium bovis]|uniref:H+/Cl-antiporter ClcA n=1 Tax=Lachnobacterium bovis TaxID=140626 RepID=A0A1H9QFY9_9FIRM|nr:chloride channel protein [Lachnobacterium bovis]SER59362.1 H+/Cl-antiporter ClcA [Lachnobacterium bovis]